MQFCHDQKERKRCRHNLLLFLLNEVLVNTLNLAYFVLYAIYLQFVLDTNPWQYLYACPCMHVYTHLHMNMKIYVYVNWENIHMCVYITSRSITEKHLLNYYLDQ